MLPLVPIRRPARHDGRAFYRLVEIRVLGGRAIVVAMASGAQTHSPGDEMAAYIVATVRISDPTRFAEYGKAIAGLSDKHGGQSVVKGAVADVFEGNSPIGERVVVTRFPDEAAARGYIESAEYKAGCALRVGAAEVEMRLLVDPA
jgi:uncharacterized protein (DUF1330 family)